MNPFKSRKALIAWLATSIATGIVTWAESHGWVPLDKRTEILETLIQCITLIWSLLGFSIAHEDKGAKEGVPPPVQLAASPAWVADVVRRHLPKAPVALLAFFLGFGAVQAGRYGDGALAYGQDAGVEDRNGVGGVRMNTREPGVYFGITT